MTTPRLHLLLRALHDRRVRYVMIGVGGANYFALDPAVHFKTYDRDLFLPPDPSNLLLAWQAAESIGLPLTCSGEPLDSPRDLWLAERVVRTRSLTRAWLEEDLAADFTLVMAGFEFEQVWRERKTFFADDIPFHVARLTHIVSSKALAGRPKDHLFIATHKEALEEMFRRDAPPAEP